MLFTNYKYLRISKLNFYNYFNLDKYFTIFSAPISVILLSIKIQIIKIKTLIK